MAASIVFLQALNLVRIVTLYWIGLHWPGMLNFAHLDIWPAIFILVTIALLLAGEIGPPSAKRFMHHRKFILSILVQFVVTYGVLIFPWPGWNDLYSQGFRAVGKRDLWKQ